MRESSTDARGVFSLDLEEDRWTVKARKGTLSGEANDRWGMVEIEADTRPQPVVIRLVERGVLRGRILDAETGQPIPGGQIWLDAAALVTADEEGRYEFGGLRQTNHHMYAVCSGYERKGFLFDTSLQKETELDIRIERAGRVRGVITDMDGNPIPNARIWNPGSGHTIALKARFAQCNEEGRFERDGVAFDVPYRFEAGASGFLEDEKDGIMVTRQNPVLDVVFQLRPDPDSVEAMQESRASSPRSSAAPSEIPLRDVTGTVFSPEGQPVANATVRWGATMYEEIQRETETDAFGRFTLEGVPDREGYFTVMADGLAPMFSQVSGGGTRKVKVVLEAGETAQGRVRDSLGSPLEGVMVVPVLSSPDPSLCNPLWLPERQAETNSDGYFKLEGLPGRGTRFDLLHPDLSELRDQTIEYGDAMNEIVMEAGGAIRGRVVDPAGTAVRDFRILIQIPQERRPDDKAGGHFAGYSGIGISFSNDRGEFVVSDLTAGNVCRVVAVAEGYSDGINDRVVIHPLNRLPSADELVIQLGAARSLSVRVIDDSEEAEPIRDARVAVLDAKRSLDGQFSWGYHDRYWSRIKRGRTGADGLVRFPATSIPEGIVVVRAEGYARRRVPWRERESELVVALDPEGVVNGMARDDDGKPLAECVVSLNASSGDGYTYSVRREDKGQFRFNELPAGNYTLTINRDRQELYKESFDIWFGEVFTVGSE